MNGPIVFRKTNAKVLFFNCNIVSYLPHCYVFFIKIIFRGCGVLHLSYVPMFS